MLGFNLKVNLVESISTAAPCVMNLTSYFWLQNTRIPPSTKRSRHTEDPRIMKRSLRFFFMPSFSGRPVAGGVGGFRVDVVAGRRPNGQPRAVVGQAPCPISGLALHTRGVEQPNGREHCTATYVDRTYPLLTIGVIATRIAHCPPSWASTALGARVDAASWRTRTMTVTKGRSFVLRYEGNVLDDNRL